MSRRTQPARPPLGPEYVMLGRAVREVRARRSLTQEGLGRESTLHRNYVSAIERGEINPHVPDPPQAGEWARRPVSELFDLFERRWTEAEADRC